MILYIGCVCVRSSCDTVLLNSERFHLLLPMNNHCFCNISTISGCDFQFTVPVWTQQEINVSPVLYHSISPVFLGIGLDLIHSFLTHPSLKQALESVKSAGNQAILTVAHNGAKIANIFAEISSKGHHSWWEALFGWSEHATNAFNVMLHPIIIILIFQAVLAFCLIALVCWVKRQIISLQSITDLHLSHRPTIVYAYFLFQYIHPTLKGFL